MPPTYDPGTISSPTSNDPSEYNDVDPIASQWQQLASMDRQSPDFLPLLSSLIGGTNCSSTIELRGEDAKVTLSALDEVGYPFVVTKEWSGSNLCCTVRQLFRGGKIPNEYGRSTLSVMRALAHDSCQVPPRYLVDPNELTMDGGLIGSGSFAVIRKGTLGDKMVAVRTLKPGPQTDPRNSVQKVCAASDYFFQNYQ